MSSNTSAAIKWILFGLAGFTAGSLFHFTLVGYSLTGTIGDGVAAILFTPISLTMGLAHEFQHLTAFHLFCLFGGGVLWAVSCLGNFKYPRMKSAMVMVSSGMVGYTNAFIFWTMMGI